MEKIEIETFNLDKIENLQKSAFPAGGTVCAETKTIVETTI